MRPSVWESWERGWGGDLAHVRVCCIRVWGGGGDLKESLVCVHPCVGRWGGYAPSLAVANMTMCVRDALVGACVHGCVRGWRSVEHLRPSFFLAQLALQWHCRCTSR